MNKEELYNTILNNPTHKYSLLNEIYAIRDTKVEKQDYTIGVNGFISLDVLLENYNQVNIIENLQHQLEEKEEQINIMSEAFDELKHQKQDYTQINILEMKLEEKQKVIDKVKKYCKSKTEFNCFGDSLTEKAIDTYVSATKKDILEILEREGENN